MSNIKSALQAALDRLAVERAVPPPVTELLDEWESDDAKTAATQTPETLPTIQQATTMTHPYADCTISEQTFNLIRDVPYILLPDALSALSARGHNFHTTSSLISQMVRQGMISRDKDNKLTALQKKYTPIQSMKSRAYLAAASKALKAKKKVKIVKKPRELPVPVFIEAQATSTKGIAALNSTPPATQAQPTPAPMPTTAETSQLLTAKQVLETLSIKEAHVLYRELQTMFG